MRSVIKAVCFPLVVFGFVWDVLHSFFEYGQYLGNAWLKRVYALSPEQKRAVEDASLAAARQQFPGCDVQLDRASGTITVTRPGEKVDGEKVH